MKMIKHKSKLVLIIVCILCVKMTFAQTKQDVYCNENIVWAGIGEMDIVIDSDSNTDWKAYKISHLGSFYKQYHRDLKENPKPLNQLIIEDADVVDFYATDKLKEKIDYNLLDLTDPMYEPENYGDQGGRFPAAAFDVFRLRYYLYFDQSNNDFHISPIAIGVMRSTYDAPDEVFDYEILGWLSVNEWKSTFFKNDNIAFTRRFYRDVAFEDIYVFKKEWSIYQVMDTMTARIRKEGIATWWSEGEVELYEMTYDSLDGSRRLSSQEMERIGTYENVTITEDGWDWEEKIEYVPWNADDYYKGLRLTLDWAWDNSKYNFYSRFQAYAPLYEVTNDLDETLFLQPLFLKKLSK